MTAKTFDEALRLVLKHEGGYSDNPADPGGATNLGITIATLRDYRGHAVSKADVKTLTVAEAGAIYRKNYWDKVRGDDLLSGLDYAVFDFAVNSGVGRAADFLQTCLRVDADGKIGPATLDAMRGRDVRQTIIELCDSRLAWLKRLPTWKTFGKGWSSRVEDVRGRALAMVTATVLAPKPVPPPPDVPAPAPAPPARSPPSPIPPAGAAVAVGAAAAIAVFWQHIAAFFHHLF